MEIDSTNNAVISDVNMQQAEMLSDVNPSENSSVTSDSADNVQNGTQGNDTNESSDTEFEFEFLSSSPMARRETSVSPDPAEEVLDKLYEAASSGDSSELVNLMFTKMGKGSTKGAGGQRGKVSENQAMLNMIKRKTANNENITSEESKVAKRRKMLSDINELAKYSKIRNIGNIGDLSYPSDPVPETNGYPYNKPPERKKNPHRTPTPPLIESPIIWNKREPNTSGEKSIIRYDKRKRNTLAKLTLSDDSTQQTPTEASTQQIPTEASTHQTPPEASKEEIPLLASMVETYTSLLTGKTCSTLKNRASIVVPASLSNSQKSATPENSNSREISYDSNVDSDSEDRSHTERNLIDYTVLTKALTKTLESKLNDRENNDVKIVIFCNNKPIQSFTVQNNKHKAETTVVNRSSAETTPTSANNDPNMSDTAVSCQDDGFIPPLHNLSFPTYRTNPLHLTSINKANAHLVPANTIPTIADVKAILERNRQIAAESLAKFSKIKKAKALARCKERQKFKEAIKKAKIPVKKGRKYKKNSLRLFGSLPNSELPVCVPVITADVPSTSTVINQSDDSLDSTGETNLVINETLPTTDENCNINNNKDELERVICDLCGKQFKQWRYLYRHKIRMHSKVPPVQPTAGALINTNTDPISNVTNNNINSVTDGTLIDKLPDGSDIINNELAANDTLVGEIKTEVMSEEEESSPETVDHAKIKVKIKKSPTIISPTYVCEHCGSFYRSRKTLKDHFWREHAASREEEPLYIFLNGHKYECPICFMNFQTACELVDHTKSHAGETDIVCRLCGQTYSSVHSLRRHMDVIHTDLKMRPFQCELCDYAATNKWHLKEHYRRHTGEQPFICPICTKRFSHQGTMNRHCKAIHKIDIPSQRPYSRNTINDLPDLPLGSSDMVNIGDATLGYGTMDNERLINSVLEYEQDSLPNDEDVDVDVDGVDLSIVKTEPEDIEVTD